MRRGLFLFITCLSFLTTISTSLVRDTLTSSQILKRNQTLESPQGSFVLGFIPGTFSNIYLAIWYKDIPDTVVWVANRDSPLQNSTDSFLKIAENGNIVLLNSSSVSNNNDIVWSSNQTNANNQALVLQLLDTGNLVLRERNVNDPTKYLWQSFDYPTDTLLPTMNMVSWKRNLGKKTEKYLRSWKITGKDPSSGDYSFKIVFNGLEQVLLKKDDTIIYRWGPWNGESFSGVPYSKFLDLDFYSDEHVANLTFSAAVESSLSFTRLFVDSDGQVEILTWVQSVKSWVRYLLLQGDECDDYKKCGPYGVCGSKAGPVCECVKGFSPKNEQAWKVRDGSDGCVRDKNLECGSDKFYRIDYVKLPETSSVFVNRSMEIIECRELCHVNCSCTAYANVEITYGGTGCVMWFGELNDIRIYTYPIGQQDLFVRLTASELDTNLTKKVKAIIIVMVIATTFLLVICFYILWSRSSKYSDWGEFEPKKEKEKKNTENSRKQNL